MSPAPPVLLTAWRRPAATTRVLAAIRAAAPPRLFVATDGPRQDGDRPAVHATRRLIAAGVDWDCEVHELHRERWLGCGRAMAGAIDWFFSHVDEGIVIEDDCLPHPDFFPYCAELLERYRDDPRVMHIGGDNAPGIGWDAPDSYRFIRWPKVWGWATWRRAWQYYDRDLSEWAARTRGHRARRVLPDRQDREVWIPRLERLRTTGRPDTWDYQWVATLVLRGGLSVLPASNLVTNIGFGPAATHTRDPANPQAARPSRAILPLHHPDGVRLDRAADRAALLLSHGGRRRPDRRRGPVERWRDRLSRA